MESTPINLAKDDWDGDVERFPEEDNVIRKECNFSRIVFALWAWKLLFWAFDLGNVFVVLMLAHQSSINSGIDDLLKNISILLGVVIGYFVFLEIFSFFGCAKRIQQKLEYSNNYPLKWSVCVIMAFIVIFIPILSIMTISITIVIILGDENPYYVPYEYESTEYFDSPENVSLLILCWVYFFVMFCYPVALFRPGRYVAFAGISFCCGFKIMDQIKCGCIVVGEGEAESCDCPIPWYATHAVLLTILFFRAFALALGILVYHYFEEIYE